MNDGYVLLERLRALAEQEGMTLRGLVKSPQFLGPHLRNKSQDNAELCEQWDKLSDSKKQAYLHLED